MERIRDFFSDTVEDADEVGAYSEHLLRGGAGVKVDLEDESRTDAALEVLESAGAVDIDERVTQWPAGGWSGSDAAPTDSTHGAPSPSAPASSDLSATTAVESGSVAPPAAAARADRNTEGEDVIPVLREERARIERRPADRPASADELGALGERSFEIEETVERPVVQKTARVVEEVVVGKDVCTTTADIDDSVRPTEVEVTELPGSDGSPSRRAYEEFDSDFRAHFGSRQGGHGTYEEYEPAYRYGHSLAADDRYRGRDWNTLEGEARRDWERRSPGSTWERVKAAVQHAWERATH